MYLLFAKVCLVEASGRTGSLSTGYMQKAAATDRTATYAELALAIAPNQHPVCTKNCNVFKVSLLSGQMPCGGVGELERERECNVQSNGQCWPKSFTVHKTAEFQVSKEGLSHEVRH